MVAAKHDAVFLEPVPYDPHTTMLTNGCHCPDGALETVEHVFLALDNQLERFVVVIAT
jgi:hypothetical protein